MADLAREPGCRALLRPLVPKPWVVNHRQARFWTASGLPFLRVMVFSGLFDAWRVVRASTLCWLYECSGGSFDYWPGGIDGPMLSEWAPFGNVALWADTDRIYHRIGAINRGPESNYDPRHAATLLHCFVFRIHLHRSRTPV